ncbi:PQQ-binding-like beta-propeller repeat protein [Flagellimonas algicola]|uniref:C-type cytochrome n=1 Tax=Flagellimonas algicola TaxID=2583815 RepID=A0ABY2WGL2_9FLAO|nr:PQQ-binding-like beta-propeller repeat protein [Allomuricauda algicola]TMU50704.1 c-type cytochrome [Allomuricauda algicola]
MKFSLYILYFALLFAPFASCDPKKQTPGPSSNSWKVYRGSYESNAHSDLGQINLNNVDHLNVAWVYKTGDSNTSSSMQCNPLIIDGILYTTTPGLKVVALDAATGNEIWKYDPTSNNKNMGKGLAGTSRGLTYWEDGEDKRLFHSVLNEIQAIDVKTGKLDPSFGEKGVVDLRDHLDREINKETAYIRNTSPGVVYKDLLIMGSSINESYRSLPGHIRAYNVRTGELKWIFHTIPHPGEFGYESWPKDYYKTGGGANAWAGLSLDTERGILYAPLGSPTHDFYGNNRKGKGLFGNSLIALDAKTGTYKWHFQVSHHDLWDYDLPAPPNLVSVNHDGKKIDAVAQLTKQGLIFLLDRETGAPLFEVRERPVPISCMEGESSWPTQPFPVKPPPLVRQYFDRTLITDLSKESSENIKDQITDFSWGSIYTPPDKYGIVQLPGFRGGAEWSGGAYDPDSNIIYVGVNDIPNLVQLVEDIGMQEQVGEFDDMATVGKKLYTDNCASCHGSNLEGNTVFPSLADLKNRIRIEDASSLLKTGRGMMPSFKQIPESNRRAILAYLYHLENEQAAKQMPLVEQPSIESKTSKEGATAYKLKAYQQLRDQEGYPGIKPPWGKLCAVNLNSGEIEWEIPLGEYQELTNRGIPPTGTQLFGGGIVTAGDLIFIGASRDEKFRAINKHTGEIAWEYDLPAGAYATPSTYLANGEQYVVVAAGGGGLQGTRSGDYLFAFKLKKDL